MQILIKMRMHVTHISMRFLLITAFAQWLFVLAANFDVLCSASTSSVVLRQAQHSYLVAIFLGANFDVPAT